MLSGSLKYMIRKLLKFRYLFGLSNRRSSRRVSQWFKWLSPGLLVKRWLAMSIAGVVLTSLGLAIWTGMTPVFYLLQLSKDFLGWITQIIPNSFSGPLILVIGILLIFLGQTRTLNAITQVLMPDGEEELIDRLLTHRRLNRGPKIVVVGG
ncbi:MAG: hypothetical protein WBA13_13930, partial [Microcoleaceae cyanobacterium]